MRAGELRQRITIQQHPAGTDEAGQPLDNWVDVGTLSANIGHDTGKAAIRQSGSVPVPYAQYSFKVRFADATLLGVTAGMRVSHAGEFFDIKGLTRDFQTRDAAFIICELGGNEG